MRSGSIQKGERADKYIQAGKTFLEENREAINWVLSEFGGANSATLELDATIVYVDREEMMKQRRLSKQEMIRLVHDVKPRFSEEVISASIDNLVAKNMLRSLKELAKSESGS